MKKKSWPYAYSIDSQTVGNLPLGKLPPGSFPDSQMFSTFFCFTTVLPKLGVNYPRILFRFHRGFIGFLFHFHWVSPIFFALQPLSQQFLGGNDPEKDWKPSGNLATVPLYDFLGVTNPRKIGNRMAIWQQCLCMIFWGVTTPKKMGNLREVWKWFF